MKNFNDGGFRKGGFSGRPKFGGNKFKGGRNDKRRGGDSFGGRDRGNNGGRQEMFSATCSTCSKSCELPFRPSGDKPVYCSACFGKQNSEGSGDSRGSYRDGAKRNDSRSGRPDYTKLPRDQRPPRHAKRESQSENELTEIKQKLATIESRLNRILDIINPPISSVKDEVVEEAVKAVAKKPSVKKAVKSKVVSKKAVAKKSAAKKPTKKAAKKQ